MESLEWMYTQFATNLAVYDMDGHMSDSGRWNAGHNITSVATRLRPIPAPPQLSPSVLS
jgi:hypothetical protein